MKKILSIFVLVILLMLPLSVAADEPDNACELTQIEFNNATINEEFSKDVFEYTVTLEDSSITPTLKSYKLSSKGNILVTYEFDEA